jgi:hypothetical protein
MLLQCTRTYSISKFRFLPSNSATDWIFQLARSKLHKHIKTGGEFNIKSKPIIHSAPKNVLLYYLNTPLFLDNAFSFYDFLAYFSIQDPVNGSFVLILPCTFQHTHPVKDTLSYQTINILVFPYAISGERKLSHHRTYSAYCIQWNETSSHIYLAHCSIQHPVKWSCVTPLPCILLYTALYQLKFSNTITLHIPV